MEISCDVIRDLLPLYAENLTSQDSNQIVDEHLCGCDACAEELAVLKKAAVVLDVDVGPLKRIRKTISQRRLLTALLPVLLIPLILLGGFTVLTRPIYMSYEQSGVEIIEKDGQIFYNFAEDVDAFTIVGIEYLDSAEEPTFCVAAYRRLWNHHYGNMLIADCNNADGISPVSTPKTVQRICYNARAVGQEDILLWGAEMTDSPVVWPENWLPDLWSWALLLGAAALVFAGVVHGQKTRSILRCTAALSVSYGVWELLITGGHWSLLPESDQAMYLCFLIVLAILTWLTSLTVMKLRKLEQ